MCQYIYGSSSIGSIQDMISDDSAEKTADNEYYFRIYVHVIRRSDGTGGMTPAQVDASLNILYDGYTSANIFFVRAENEIDYIDNDDFYEQTYDRSIVCEISTTIDPNTGALMYSHDDGIDIFFDSPNQISLPGPNGEDIDLAGGVAIGIPGTNYFLWGVWNTSVITPMPTALTPAVIHEMGHCLGLYHTHHSLEILPFTNCEGETIMPHVCEENIVPYHENNGLECGDFVADTYADHNLDQNVSPTTCQPNPAITAKDDDGHYFTPLTDNYMSYSSLDCMNNFTDGQIERMHLMIEISQVLTDCLIETDTPPLSNDWVITGTETWTTANAPFNDGINGIYKVKGNLIIEDGALLTIEDGVIVQFGNEKGCLIVKTGGKLALSGTLAGKDASSSWRGVRVCGNPQSSQFGQYSWQLSENQGQFLGISGTIENAEIGITNYNPINSTLAGGIIQCSEDMTFKNNRIALDFKAYQNFYGTPVDENPRNDLSRFSECQFITDDNYILDKQFYAFMQLKKASGIIISGCNFSNNQTIVGDEIIDWGYGILAEDAKFTVNSWCNDNTFPCNDATPTIFNSLGEAISQKTVEYQRPYLVKEAVFNNCFIGIRNTVISTANILFNEFNLGDLPAVNFEVQQYGVIFEGGSININCEENTFTGTGNNPDIDKIGIYCYETGQANKQIRKNQFNNLTAGALVAGRNGNISNFDDPEYISTGLVYLCNEFNNTVAQPDQSDIQINYSPKNLIKYEQGWEQMDDNNNLAYFSAGNHFSNIGIDFRGNNATPINYYYDPNGNNEEPVTFTNDPFTPIQAPSNDCPTNYCEPPCKTEVEINSIKGAYFDHITQIDGLLDINIQNYTIETSHELNYHQRLKDEVVNTTVTHTLYDTVNFDLDTLKTWIGRHHSVEGDLWLIRMAIGEEDFTTAESILGQIPQKFDLIPEQITDYNHTSGMLTLLEGKKITNLPSNTINQLKAFDDVGGDAELWAQNILGLYGYYYPPKYETSGKDKKGLIKFPTHAQQKEETYLRLQPNPAKQYVEFSFEAKRENEGGLLQIKNIGGKTVFEQQVHPNDVITWAVNHNPSGIYFYQFISQGAILQSGKISINK